MTNNLNKSNREVIQVYKDDWEHLKDLHRDALSEELGLYCLLSAFIVDEKLYDQWIPFLQRMIQLEKEDKLELDYYGNLEEHLENWTTPE